MCEFNTPFRMGGNGAGKLVAKPKGAGSLIVEGRDIISPLPAPVNSGMTPAPQDNGGGDDKNPKVLISESVPAIHPRPLSQWHKFISPNTPEKEQTLLQQFISEAEEQIHAEQKAHTFMRKVAFILEKYPSCKGDDNQLIYRYWREFHPDVKMTFPQFEKLMALTRAESIVRFRRWINERGVVVDGQVKRYLPTPETTSKRRAMCGRVERVMLERGI